MGLYSKHILPRVIDLVMRNREASRLRAAWIPRARGEVLEIGIGSGVNLPFYSPGVTRVIGVDPSAQSLKLAGRKAKQGGVEVELLAQSAEEALPLEAESIDTVVIFWSLCSIPDPRKALVEVRRVLKPTGRLIFLEHGRSPDHAVQTWQNRLTPFWRPFAGGCRLNREIDRLIEGAGFRIEELKTGYLAAQRTGIRISRSKRIRPPSTRRIFPKTSFLE